MNEQVYNLTTAMFIFAMRGIKLTLPLAGFFICNNRNQLKNRKNYGHIPTNLNTFFPKNSFSPLKRTFHMLTTSWKHFIERHMRDYCECCPPAKQAKPIQRSRGRDFVACFCRQVRTAASCPHTTIQHHRCHKWCEKYAVESHLKTAVCEDGETSPNEACS